MDSLFNSPTPNTSPFTSDFDNTLNKNISSILSLLGSPTDDDTPEKKPINVLKGKTFQLKVLKPILSFSWAAYEVHVGRRILLVACPAVPQCFVSR